MQGKKTSDLLGIEDSRVDELLEECKKYFDSSNGDNFEFIEKITKNLDDKTNNEILFLGFINAIFFERNQQTINLNQGDNKENDNGNE